MHRVRRAFALQVSLMIATWIEWGKTFAELGEFLGGQEHETCPAGTIIEYRTGRWIGEFYDQNTRKWTRGTYVTETHRELLGDTDQWAGCSGEGVLRYGSDTIDRYCLDLVPLVQEITKVPA